MTQQRRVMLTDAYGDFVHAIEHWPSQSDLPGTYTVNGCRWFTTVWAQRGWEFHEALGEWEP